MSNVVVLADDEPYILHVLAIKLRNAGFEVFTASDGEEALKVCLNAAPDLIITDYQMPGLSGPEFCLKYRNSSDRKIPAILVTARDFDIDENELLQAGISLVVTKPFSPRQIIEHVRDIIKKVKTPLNAA